jgi:hypothetical protein
MDHHVAWVAAVIRGDHGCVGRFRPFFPSLLLAIRSGGWVVSRPGRRGGERYVITGIRRDRHQQSLCVPVSLSVGGRCNDRW